MKTHLTIFLKYVQQIQKPMKWDEKRNIYIWKKKCSKEGGEVSMNTACYQEKYKLLFLFQPLLINYLYLWPWYTQQRAKQSAHLPPYEVKWALFKRAWAYKITAMPSWGFQTTIDTFQMRYCMMFYLKGHQNCQKLKI